MENTNIVMLKRHFVSYKNVKETTYYLNQCKDLAEYEVIDATSHNSDPKFKSEISPMFIGPCTASDGTVCNVFETLWQCSKVYPCHVKEDGEPSAEYFKWRNDHFSKAKPPLNARKEIHQLRHPNEELGCNHGDALYTCWFDPNTGKYEHLSYVQARKQIYFPQYVKLVYGTDSFKKLKDMVDKGVKVAILDYDSFNLYDDSVKEKMYLKYLEQCKKSKKEPIRTLDDYLNLRTLKDVIDCPFISVGHGWALKAMLQGDLEMVDGKLIDHCGLLK